LLNELERVGLSQEYTDLVRQTLLLDDQERPSFLQLQTQIFSLLSPDSSEKSIQLQKSYDIKSSISSMCHSKGETNVRELPHQELEEFFSSKRTKVSGNPNHQRGTASQKKEAISQIEPNSNVANLGKESGKKGKYAFQKSMDEFFGDSTQTHPNTHHTLPMQKTGCDQHLATSTSKAPCNQKKERPS
jgi:hypothetical protein